jgi:hypothetical protein
MVSEKAKENRLRRMADRQGLRLLKARSRDRRAIDFGRYALADLGTNAIVFGVSRIGRFSASMGEIEDYLTSNDDKEARP